MPLVLRYYCFSIFFWNNKSSFFSLQFFPSSSMLRLLHLFPMFRKQTKSRSLRNGWEMGMCHHRKLNWMLDSKVRRNELINMGWISLVWAKPSKSKEYTTGHIQSKCFKSWYCCCCYYYFSLTKTWYSFQAPFKTEMQKPMRNCRWHFGNGIFFFFVSVHKVSLSATYRNVILISLSKLESTIWERKGCEYLGGFVKLHKYL